MSQQAADETDKQQTTERAKETEIETKRGRVNNTSTMDKSQQFL